MATANKPKPPAHPATTSTTTPSGILANVPDSIPPLSIDPEIRDLIPPLSKQERQELEKSLRSEGCLDRLKGWAQTGILLDGHNRKEICEAAAIEIEYDVEWLDFASRAEAIDFVLGLQLARRNISEEQQAYLIGKRLENESQPQGGDRTAKPQVEALPRPKGKTAERIAKETGKSRATVERNGVYSKAVDKLAQVGGSQLKGQLTKGTIKCSDAAAKAVLALPPAKLAETVERLKNGTGDVGAAIPTSHRPGHKPTGVRQQQARETKGRAIETERGVGETEFRETVLTRLRELQGLTADMKGPQKPVKQRVLELLTFVEAWK